jgi:nucleoid-associated protein YgaU
MDILGSIRNAFGGKAAETDAKTYRVQSGDTLWRISELMYGDGSRYMEIFEANNGLLEDPDRILPGQNLVIPNPNN